MWELIKKRSENCAGTALPSGNSSAERKISAAAGERGAAVFCFLVLFFVYGCGPSDVKPVDLFPEDMCAHCRMAVSDHRFASEIILESGEVFKFDDLSCLEEYRSSRQDLKIAAVFVKEYETKTWLSWEKAVMVTTGVFTPMGSGKVAFGDSARALDFKRQHPAEGE